MSLTIDSFRAILGNVNDGNVIKDDQGNLKKVNYGRLFTKESTPSNEAVNRGLRQDFFDAIVNSNEGKLLAEADLEQLRNDILGGRVGDGADVKGDVLTRREIKQALVFISEHVTPHQMIASLGAGLYEKGVLVAGDTDAQFEFLRLANEVMSDPVLQSDETMFEALKANPKRDFNCTKVQLKDFLKLHQTLITARIADETFWARQAGGADTRTSATRCKDAVLSLMRDFAAGKVPAFQSAVIPKRAADVELVGDAHDLLAQSPIPTYREHLATLAAKLPATTVAGFTARNFLTHLQAKIDAEFLRVCQSAQGSADEKVRYVTENFSTTHAALFAQLDRFAAEFATLDAQGQTRIAALFAQAMTEQLATVDMSETSFATVTTAFASSLDRVSDTFSVRAQISACVERLYNNPADRAEAEQIMLDFYDGVTTGGDEKTYPPAIRDFYRQLRQDAVDRTDLALDVRPNTKLLESHLKASVGVRKAEAVAAMEKELGRAGRIQKQLVDAYSVIFKQSFEFDKKSPEQVLRESAVYMASAWMTKEEAKAQTTEQLLAMFNGFDEAKISFTVDYAKSGFLQADQDIAENRKVPTARPIRDYLLDSGAKLEKFGETAIRQIKLLLLRANSDHKSGPLMTFASQGSTPGPIERHLSDTLLSAMKLKEIGLGEKALEVEKGSVCPENLDVEASLRLCEIGKVLSDYIPSSIPSFTGASPEQIFNILDECGIKLEALGTARGVENLLALQLMMDKCPTGWHGLAEFCQRVLQKQPNEIGLVDFLKFAKGVDVPKAPVLNARQQNLKAMLTGALNLDELKLSPTETIAFMKAMNTLADAPEGQVETVSLKGETVRLEKRHTGSLSATVGGERFHVEGGDAFAFVAKAQDLLAVSAKDPSCAEAIRSILPEPGTTTMSDMRLRELCIKTLAAKLDAPKVLFTSFKTSELREMAHQALNGRLALETIKAQASAKSYLSQDAIEMKDKMESLALTSADKLNALVRLPPSAGSRSLDSRQLVTEKRDVHHLVSDLLAGGDLKALATAYGPELANLTKEGGRDLLKTLPKIADAETVFAGIITDLAELAKGDLNSPEADAKVAALQKQLDAFADRAIHTMQDEVNRLFAPTVGHKDEIWTKTFSEVNGQEGLDLSTVNGSFASKVLSGYFVGSGTDDQRRMIGAMLRHTDAQSSEAKCVAELLKGSGPLLQKILQGLPIESFGPETREALMDMKSRLPSIPENLVKAQMLDIINSSNGKVKSIEVKKSLGAASVGQAFLCNIKTKEHPVSGIDCVIKVLRPNASTAIQREKAIIDGLVDDRQRADFASQYEEILNELDFTLESSNVRIGMSVYEQPLVKKGDPSVTERFNGVHSMKLVDGLPATMGAMIVELAPGSTVDGYLRSVKEEFEQKLTEGGDPILKKVSTDPEAPAETVYGSKDLHQVLEAKKTASVRITELRESRAKLMNIVTTWFEEAIFGGRFFQGDMHAGNIMMDAQGATIIDFGNCHRLTENEHKMILKLFVRTMTGDAGGFVDAIAGSLPTEAEQKAFKKAAEGATKDLKVVLAKGTANDVLPRLQSGLTVLQRQGLSLPPALTQFVQSFVRLSGAVSAYDGQIQDLLDTAVQIRWTETDPLPPLPEGLREGSAFHAVDAFLEKARTDLGTTQGDAGLVDEAHALTGRLSGLLKGLRFKEMGQDTVLALVNRYRSLMTADEYAETVAAIERNIANPDPVSEDRLNGVMRNCLALVLRKFQQIAPKSMSPEDQIGFEDLVNEIVWEHSDYLKDQAGALFGTFMQLTVGLSLVSAQNTAGEIDARVKARVATLTDDNALKPEAERLTDAEITALTRCAKNFCRPTTLPKDAKDGTLLHILEVNLAQIRKALPTTKITSKHVTFMFELAAAWEHADIGKTMLGLIRGLNDKAMMELQISLGKDHPDLYAMLTALHAKPEEVPVFKA